MENHLNIFTMTAGIYYITDACMSDDWYYDWLLKFEWETNGEKCGSTFIRHTGFDGSYPITNMKNEIVGYSGSDAANVSIVPAKVISNMPSHMGIKVEFKEDFVVKSYHDAIVIDDEYRIRIR